MIAQQENVRPEFRQEIHPGFPIGADVVSLFLWVCASPEASQVPIIAKVHAEVRFECFAEFEEGLCVLSVDKLAVIVANCHYALQAHVPFFLRFTLTAFRSSGCFFGGSALESQTCLGKSAMMSRSSWPSGFI